MDKVAQFYEMIKKDMVVTLATAAGPSVTMRAVSPVYYAGGVLFFTAPSSRKYQQLKVNPHCCIAAGLFFAEATASFLGATMAPDNAELRAAYAEKFPGAFDEGIAFGGRDAEFVLLKPTRLTGWAFENDVPTPEGIPTVPFDVAVCEQG